MHPTVQGTAQRNAPEVPAQVFAHLLLDATLLLQNQANCLTKITITVRRKLFPKLFLEASENFERRSTNKLVERAFRSSHRQRLGKLSGYALQNFVGRNLWKGAAPIDKNSFKFLYKCLRFIPVFLSREGREPFSLWPRNHPCLVYKLQVDNPYFVTRVHRKMGFCEKKGYVDILCAQYPTARLVLSYCLHYVDILCIRVLCSKLPRNLFILTNTPKNYFRLHSYNNQAATEHKEVNTSVNSTAAESNFRRY